MKHYFTLTTFALLLFISCETHAQQVLVNQTVYDTSLGSPAVAYNFNKAVQLPNGGIALLDNSVITGLNQYNYNIVFF